MIVLIKINHPDYTYHPPLGLLYVANALIKSGFDVKIFHIPANNVSDYVQKIVELRPMFVGFSVFTGEAMRSYAWLCRKIKSLSDVPIVWGNAHPSLMPEQCLKEDYIDIVVIGEGEITAVELAKSLKTGIPELKDIKGIGFKDDNGNVVINEARPFLENLDEYKPEWDLLDVEYYIRPYYKDGKRTIPISTSRGCPYNCGFCYNKKFNKCKWRAHSASYVTSLVKELREKYSIDSIIITDDNFFVDKERAFKILEEIDLPYYCETKSAYFDEKFGESLHKTKCRAVLLGMESGSDRVLKFINKKSTVNDNIKAVRSVSRYPEITISGSFIVAFPTETEEECKQSMELIVRLLEIKKEMNFTLGYYLPYPGSSLYELVKEKGFIPPARTEDWEDIDRWASKTRITWVDWITSEKAVTLRSAVFLLRDSYQSSSKFSLVRNYIKKQVISLNVESFGMRLLLEMRKSSGKGKYRLFISSLRRIYHIPPIFKLIDLLKNMLIERTLMQK
ncbi:B12-binding domain-containing radical SAM protein [Thermodesulfobacteriota bacterium]